jgi:hypothetical protein
VSNVAKRIKRMTKSVPKGCAKSLRARRCPATVDFGIVPGPADSRQASVENYPYVDQITALTALLHTLPKVRYRSAGHVPLGAEVTTAIAITGRASRRLVLEWSVYAAGEAQQPPVAWERSRIADFIHSGQSTHLSDFWVPIPAVRRRYEVFLRVVDEGTGDILARRVALPTFS